MPVAKQKPGYKHTDAGIIPEDWDLKPLILLAQVRSGVAKNANVKISDPVSVHYLRVANVQDGYLDLAEMSQIVIERSDLRRFAVIPGDVLMNEGGDRDKLGRGCVWDGQFNPCVHQNHVFVVRCKRQLHPRYLTAWTQTAIAKAFFVNAGSQTTNLASINKTALGQLPVLLPHTLAEQEAIADALSDADGLIESLEKLIAKKRQIKHGTMQELLTGKRRLPGFSGKWDIVRIGDLFAFKNGLNKSKRYFGHGTPIVNYMDVFSKRGVRSNELRGRVSLSREERNAYEVRKGDVFFTRTSETLADVGMTSVLLDEPRETVFSGFVLRARPKDDSLDLAFKQYCFSTQAIRQQITSQSSETTRALTSGRALSAVVMPRPPLLEQTAIAAILSDMDADIAALEAKLAKARQVKQGMMQELLTGRIRLVGKGVENGS